MDPSELERLDSDSMAARYEQTLREQQSNLAKEDFSDMVAEHAAKQKVSGQLIGANERQILQLSIYYLFTYRAYLYALYTYFAEQEEAATGTDRHQTGQEVQGVQILNNYQHALMQYHLQMTIQHVSIHVCK